uniref:Uncharacterized protein n=1 Tax=Plectus sambesii TaxID=2011161 RepID=A0A914UWN9_9BILA
MTSCRNATIQLRKGRLQLEKEDFVIELFTLACYNHNYHNDDNINNQLYHNYVKYYNHFNNNFTSYYNYIYFHSGNNTSDHNKYSVFTRMSN